MVKHLSSPISYYGGKKNMLQHIVPRIPKHIIYTEPFFGGGAVFFAKEQAQSEIVNDISNMVVNFFKVAQTSFQELKEKIEETLFSRATYSSAMVIWKTPHLFNEIVQAWAFYVGCNMGFATGVGSWGYDKYGKRVKAFLNKKMSFDTSIINRLNCATIESGDANQVIKAYDSEDTFHYVDPPYIDTAQGHYKGYNKIAFTQLLETLTHIKGKFILSSYPTEILEEYTKKNNWYTQPFEKVLTAGKAVDGAREKKKIEVLTANFPI